MGLAKKFATWFKNLKFRTKLVLFYITLLIIPIVFIGLRYYYISMDVVSDLVSKNVYEIVKKNNQIIDVKLSKIEENSLAMTVDQDLFKTFNEAKNLNILQMDRQVTKVINKYFTQSPDVYSVQIVTSYYTFGNNLSLITGENFENSKLKAYAKEAGGKLRWIPTYDFTVMFGYNEFKNIELPGDRYIFSAVRQINSFYLDNGVFSVLDRGIEIPVLIVNFSERLFQNVFQNSIPIDGIQYFVISEDGNIVFHNDREKLATAEKPDWLGEVSSKGSGTGFINIDGKKNIICYDKSKVTGWISVAIIPAGKIMGNIVPVMRSSTIFIAIIFAVISLFLGVLVSGKISKPIKKLVKAMESMGEGNFDTRIQVESRDELGYLIEKFNSLNEKVKKLIDENYKVRIREKEAEIMALNLQLNPHFLYNTMNVINWMAIEAGQENISNVIVNLCDMLIYSLKNKKDVMPFEDDLKWLESYLSIMSNRFEDKFIVQFHIDPMTYKCEVPKLFLQPFIENSIIHGFEYIESGGIIKITSRIDGYVIHFYIEDNGIGMKPEEIEEVMNTERSSIGVRNVDKRIKLLYGEGYGVQIKSQYGAGTKVLITIPTKNQSTYKNIIPL